MSERIYAGTVDELQRDGVIVVKGGRHGIGVFWNDGNVVAVDNRCPHLGFPLHMGSVCDGILTCHWHHARFDVQSGGTLDPWADDVPTYSVQVQEGGIWVDPTPRGDRTRENLRRRLREGLEQNLSLVIAKAVVGLIEAGEPEADIARIGVEFGTTHRRGGWRSGLTILTAMMNVLPKLDHTGRILALYQGLVHIARESEGTRFPLEPLPAGQVSTKRLADWYRRCIEVRDSQGAERVLRTAVQAGTSTSQLADMMMAAVTDHFYMDGGHALDFHNKAFEILEVVGPGYTERVLTSILPQMGSASRSEEMHSWQSPVDLVTPLRDAFSALPAGRVYVAPTLIDDESMLDQLLSDRPVETIQTLLSALHAGVPPERLAQLTALAAAERIVRFNLQNEFGDWITVLHTFTHNHAVHAALRRSAHPDLTRAIFHGAMSVYLNRFLNVPLARRPKPNLESAAASRPEHLLELLDRQQQVNAAAQFVVDYLAGGGNKDALLNMLGHALLREDAEFHSFQMFEAAVREHDMWAAEHGRFAEKAKQTLILAATRYLAAHAPTAREMPHTARIAMRLQRGEKLFEEE